MGAMCRIKKLLNRLSDDKVNKFIGLCSKLEVNKILEEIGDLDFQGSSLVRAVRCPSALIAALYFVFSSLTSPNN